MPLRAKRKSVLFIATGGTLASATSAAGLRPALSADDIVARFPDAGEIADITTFQLANLDSTNVQPALWTALANHIWQHRERYDGFVVGHGTDTLEYTSAALSFALAGFGKPVVVTGSVLAPAHPESDARHNFLDALRIAVHPQLREVYVCFHGKVIKGTHVRKVTNEATKIVNEHIGVYSSINAPHVAAVESRRVFLNGGYLHMLAARPVAPAFRPAFEATAVGLVKLFPGLSADVLDYWRCRPGIRAVVLEAMGPGNVPFNYGGWLEKISALRQAGILIAITSPNVFGESDLSLYEVGQRVAAAGALSACDMSTSTTLVKLMWIYGNNPEASLTKAENTFTHNITGEFFQGRGRHCSLRQT